MKKDEKISGIHIAVCEDLEEDKSRLVGMLKAYLEENHIQAVIDTFCSGEEFLKSETGIYSLVFFDIYMDKLNGMETAQKLIEENSTVQLVFVSTTRDFAAESYDVSALHYMIKPVEQPKLYLVLNKFFDGIKHMRTITIKVGRAEQVIYVHDILYVESNNKRTLVHTKQQTIEASMPLSSFFELLQEPDFIKPIRYALVAVKEIIKVPADSLLLSDGTQIPISRLEREHVKNVFMEYKWKESFAREEVRI